MSNIVIIDYGYGNLHSVTKAVEAVMPKNSNLKLSNNPGDIVKADHIILPGVGAFADCMDGLDKIKDLKSSLNEAVLTRKKNFLGICVGMQLLATDGYEHGKRAGLGFIEGSVIAIPSKDNDLKIPHMGWNNLQIIKDHPIFAGIENNSDVYFVHSYFMKCKDKKVIAGVVNYGEELQAIIIKDNIIGMQFHPEKSQKIGLKLLANFLTL